MPDMPMPPMPDEVDLLVALKHGRAGRCSAARRCASIVTSRAEPPNEMNGSGSPLVGSEPGHHAEVHQRLGGDQHGDAERQVARRTASGARSPTRSPRQISTTKSATMATAPTKPSSSPTMAKMKSVCDSGR